MLNKYFPMIFVINLERRIDRKLSFLKHSQRHLSDVQFIYGVDGWDIDFNNPDNLPHFSAGDVGCALSHLKVVHAAKQHNLPFYLVLEDDVKFHRNFELFPKFWKEVPEDWDLVYF